MAINTLRPLEMSSSVLALSYKSQTSIDKSQNTQRLRHLVEKLNDFDCEKIYTIIQNDLTEKYNLAEAYFKQIESTRKELIAKGKLNNCKKQLVAELDAIVSTLRRDFSGFSEDKYRLLDEVFLIKTNNHVKWSFDDIGVRVEEILQRPEAVYKEEFSKMERIYEILEEEGKKLMEIE